MADIDYAALAQQAGGTVVAQPQNQPAQPAQQAQPPAIDYAALARQAGGTVGTETTQPQQQVQQPQQPDSKPSQDQIDWGLGGDDVVQEYSGTGQGLLGVLKGMAETGHTGLAAASWYAKKMLGDNAIKGTMFDVPFQQPQQLQAKNPQQEAGKVVESAVEFFMGLDEVKGLSWAEKLSEAKGFAKLLEDYPTLAKAFHIGASAFNTGAVGTTQALAHGAPVGQALKSGAQTALVGGGLEGAEIFSSAKDVPKLVNIAATIAKHAGTTFLAGQGVMQAIQPQQEGESEQQAFSRQLNGLIQAGLSAPGAFEAITEASGAAAKLPGAAKKAGKAIIGTSEEHPHDVLREAAGKTTLSASANKPGVFKPTFNQHLNTIEPDLQDIAAQPLQGKTGNEKLVDFNSRLTAKEKELWQQHKDAVSQATSGVPLSVTSIDSTALGNALLDGIRPSARVADPQGVDSAREFISQAFDKNMSLETADDAIRDLNAEVGSANPAWGNIGVEIRQEVADKLREARNEAIERGLEYREKTGNPVPKEDIENISNIDQRWGSLREVHKDIFKESIKQKHEEPKKRSVALGAAIGAGAGAEVGRLPVVGEVPGILGGAALGAGKVALDNLRAKNGALGERLDRALTGIREGTSPTITPIPGSVSTQPGSQPGTQPTSPNQPSGPNQPNQPNQNAPAGISATIPQETETTDVKQQADKISEDHGIEFRGVQEGPEGHPGLAVFQDPESKTSIAIRLDELSPEKVQERLESARDSMAISSDVEARVSQDPAMSNIRKLTKQAKELRDRINGGEYSVENLNKFNDLNKQLQAARASYTPPASLKRNLVPGSTELKKPSFMTDEENNPPSARLHEIGHMLVGEAAGLKFEPGVKSHLHPGLNPGTVAAVTLDVPNSDLSSQEWLQQNMPGLLATYVAGGISQEIHSGISWDDNTGLVGDKRGIRRLFSVLNVPESDHAALIEAAKDQARKVLTQPGLSDILKEATKNREEGIADKWQMSPEATEKIRQQVQDLRGQNGQDEEARTDGAGSRQESNQRNSPDVAGRKNPNQGQLIFETRHKAEPADEDEIAPGDTISTRIPGAGDKTHGLDVSGDVIKSNPKLAQRVADTVKDMPGFRFSKKDLADPSATIDSFTRQVKDNLKWVYGLTTPEERALSGQWYKSANKMTKDLADQFGVDYRQAAGVTAALSPNNDWDRNLHQAKRVMETYSTKQDFAMTPEMEKEGERIRKKRTGNKDLLNSLDNNIKGKKLSELDNPVDKAAWIRLYDEAHNTPNYETWGPDGQSKGLVRKNNGKPAAAGWGFLNPIANAVKIMDDGSRESISSTLASAKGVTQHKVRSFYNNIIEPDSPRNDVTIDTHAVAAGHAQPFSGKSSEVKQNFSGVKNKPTGISGIYPLHQDAYRQAAKELDIEHPRELQSIVWEKVRKLFPKEFKSVKGNKEGIQNIWQEYSDGKISISKARQQVLEAAGQGPDSGVAGEKRVSGNEGKLPDAKRVRVEQTGRGTGTAGRPRVRGGVAALAGD